MALYSEEGDIILTGDFNARTGVLPDFTTHDSNVYIPLPPEYVSDVDQARFNSDHLVNNYGKEFLNMCISSNLRIVNGRTGSDKRVGSFTCYTPRGCSVVDYFVVSQNLMESISDMSVHNLTEHSDHCPISLDISIPKMTKQSKTMANTRMEGKDRRVTVTGLSGMRKTTAENF